MPNNSFTDNKGRTWACRVDFRRYRRLHALGFNCADIVQWSKLAEDGELSWRVLCELCGDDMKARDVSEFDFESGFDLDVLEHALTAVVDAIIEFLPKQKRDVVRKAWTAFQKQSTDALERLEAALDNGELLGSTRER